MDDARPDPQRARGLAVGIIAGLAFVALLLVVIAVVTDTYILLTGLLAVGAGGATALWLLRSEQKLDEH